MGRRRECGGFYRRKCALPLPPLPHVCFHKTKPLLLAFLSYHAAYSPNSPLHLSQSPVLSTLLVLSETVGVDTSLLNAPPPPARDPPDYRAGR